MIDEDRAKRNREQNRLTTRMTEDEQKGTENKIGSFVRGHEAAKCDGEYESDPIGRG